MSELLSVLFLGVVLGSLYALSATGLVLTYRTSGVFNFAHGAIGMFFAFVFFQLTQGGRVNFVIGVYDQNWRMPVALALILVVGVLAPLFGWALHMGLFSKLRTAGPVVKIVVTIGLFVAISQGLAGMMWGAAPTLAPANIFPSHVFVLGGFRVTLQDLLTMLMVAVLSGALLVFLRVSPLGVRMRAVVDKSDMAELMGIDSERVSAISWAIGTGVAALAGILLAPFFGSLDPTVLSFVVVTAAAAAVVGRLESLPLTLAGGVGIGILQFLVQRYTSTDVARQLFPSIPFLVLFGALMLPIRWRELSEAPPAPLKAPEALRPLQHRLMGKAFLAITLVIPVFILPVDWQRHLTIVPPIALLYLSLVLLSGHAGQISLSQAAFAGVGAFVAAHLVVDYGIPFLISVLIGGAAAVPLGALLASRAVALPPLFLGLATLAFAAVMDEVVFVSHVFTGGLEGIRFERPEFLAGDSTYYVAGLMLFALFSLLVGNLRRGKIGMGLSAMRDSQVGLSSLGASALRLKFVVFCTSAFIAGISGGLLAGAFQNASSFHFFKIQSLLALTLAVVGGIGRWSGALLAAAMFQLSPPFMSQPFVTQNFVVREIFNGQVEQLLPVFFGLGAILLARNPGGIIERLSGSPRRIKTEPFTEPFEVRDDRSVRSTVHDDGVVAYPKGRLYHRVSCVMGTGKEISRARRRIPPDRQPCPVCAPPPRKKGGRARKTTQLEEPQRSRQTVRHSQPRGRGKG